jgi:hypothetical protein
MKLIIIIFLVIIILTIFILFNIFIKNKRFGKNIENYYDSSYGAVPRNGSWVNGNLNNTSSENENNSNNNIGSKTEGNCKITTFGIADQSGKCLPINSNSENDLENNRFKDSLLNELSDMKNKYFDSLNKNKCTSEEDNSLLNKRNKYKKVNNNNETISTDSTYIDNKCYDNKTNFDKICRKYNKNFGIMNITPCNANTSKVSCGLNYVNGKFYGNDVYVTPCISKNDDFDTWCKYYSDKSLLPPGSNVNSIGTKYLLSGKSGDCYFDNGKIDTNSARGICDYNHIERIPKLEPIFKGAKYNKFTGCFPVNTNFTTECSYLLEDEAVATQIMGYDCNPGFFRAKCYSKSDIGNIQENNFGSNLGDTLKQDSIKCKEVCGV